MSQIPHGVRSIEDVCEVRSFAGPGAALAPALLVEIPHGATRREHFERIRRRLDGPFPDGLVDLFFVNTDAGAPECAIAIAEKISGPQGTGRSVLVVRSLLPRTFVDCNRILEATGGDGDGDPTPGIPGYVRGPSDLAVLRGLHASYTRVAERAHAWVCGSGGMALLLHTYAPKNVEIDRFDESVVDAIREAYEPARYETWGARPEVDLITQAPDGTSLAPRDLVESIRARYAEIGVAAAENATYRLHPATMAHRHALRHPGRVVCVEISRGCLAAPFAPFSEMAISASAVERMTAPLVAAILEHV